MEEKRNAYIVLVAKHCWEDNTKIDLKEDGKM
jgi:hypothetical protein